MFFRLSTLELALLLTGILFGATVLGLVLGRYLSHHAATLREPIGTVQAALLTLVGLVLAFGLAMAVSRYDARRTAVVGDANTIGTAYCGRSCCPSRCGAGHSRCSWRTPMRASTCPGRFRAVRPPGGRRRRRLAIQRRLWRLSGQADAAEPVASAPRLYIESLNEMIDMQTTRVSALNNRVPSEILLIEVVGAATALGLMAFYLAMLSRGLVTVLLAASLLTLLLFVSFDLDRPTRGFINVPDAPLVSLRTSIDLPPAAGGTR